jgi:hypothetical protein
MKGKKMIPKCVPHRIYRISAWYDLFVTWPFAAPFTMAIFWGSVMSPLNASLGLGPLPDLDVHSMLFANFFGTVVIIWSLVRLVWNDTRLAIYDGVARGFFSAWMGVALFSGITPLVWIFLVPEILFALLQIAGFFWLSCRSPEVAEA